MRSAQRLFDIVVAHLRQQGEKSVVPTGTSYSGRIHAPDGRMDAIGAILPDAEYKPEMEGGDVDDIIKSGLLSIERTLEFDKHRILLKNLQRIHDTGVSIQDWERQWHMLADDLYLRYTKP